MPMTLLRAVLLALGLLSAFPAAAQDLDALRASGQVAERFDGLLEALDGGAQGAVDAINAQRLAIYQQRAGAQGVAVDQVGRVYAEQIYGQAPAGTFFRQENGSLTQK